MLSSKVDGGELPEDYFPLRLVGPGLSEAQMPGGIAASSCGRGEGRRR